MLPWGIVVKLTRYDRPGGMFFCDHYGEMLLRKLGGFEAFDLQISRDAVTCGFCGYARIATGEKMTDGDCCSA